MEQIKRLAFLEVIRRDTQSKTGHIYEGEWGMW